MVFNSLMTNNPVYSESYAATSSNIATIVGSMLSPCLFYKSFSTSGKAACPPWELSCNAHPLVHSNPHIKHITALQRSLTNPLCLALKASTLKHKYLKELKFFYYWKLAQNNWINKTASETELIERNIWKFKNYWKQKSCKQMLCFWIRSYIGTIEARQLEVFTNGNLSAKP